MEKGDGRKGTEGLNFDQFPELVKKYSLRAFFTRSHVGRELVKLGGDPVYREGVVTDNGNIIIDVHHLHPIGSARDLEEKINNITGVVTNGLFALRPADVLLLGRESGVEQITR